MKKRRMTVIAALVAAAAAAVTGSGLALVHTTRAQAAPPPLDLSTAQGLARSAAARAVAAGGAAPGGPVTFRLVTYAASVSDAGMADAYMAFVTVSETVTVQPSSEAFVTLTDDGPPVFPAPSDRAEWQAEGSPALAPKPTDGAVEDAGPGQYTFIPQGSTLTYAQAAALPGSPGAFSAVLLDHLRAYAGPHPTAALTLDQLGYLIATAPLSAAARAAAWQVVASLPGLRLCGTGTDPAGRHGVGLCADGGGERADLLVDPHTGAVLALQDRTLRATPLYPTVPAGGLTDAVAFS